MRIIAGPGKVFLPHPPKVINHEGEGHQFVKKVHIDLDFFSPF